MADTFHKEYKPLGEEASQLITDIKEQAEKLHALIGKAESIGTAGDTIQTARQKVHEAVFWAIHGIES